MRTIIKNTLMLALGTLSLGAYADMQPMNEAELESTNGQQGITQSYRVEFTEGTRISYANPDAQYKNPPPGGGHYWLVIDNITGSLEYKNQKTDYISDFGPQKNVGAVRTTMAEEVTFDNFKTKGVYLGAGKEVTRSAAGAVTSGHQYIMGLEINGTLQYGNTQGGTTMTVFAID